MNQHSRSGIWHQHFVTFGEMWGKDPRGEPMCQKQEYLGRVESAAFYHFFGNILIF